MIVAVSKGKELIAPIQIRCHTIEGKPDIFLSFHLFLVVEEGHNSFKVVDQGQCPLARRGTPSFFNRFDGYKALSFSHKGRTLVGPVSHP